MPREAKIRIQEDKHFLPKKINLKNHNEIYDW